MPVKCGCCHGTHPTSADVRTCCAARRSAVAPQFKATSDLRKAVPPLDAATVERVAYMDLVGTINEALTQVKSQRHADVLRMRLGMGGAPPMTLERIGGQIGVSRARVRQLEEAALGRLHGALRRTKTEFLADFQSALRAKTPGYGDRVIAATAVMAPDWPARPARKLVMRLAGAKDPTALYDNRSLRLVYDHGEAAIQEAPGPTASLDDGAVSVYEAITNRFGIKAGGHWRRFSAPGWFYVGQSVAECPVCGLVLEAFRRPYTTSAGVEYHYWALACLKCAAFWAPADLDGDGRKELYRSSEHRPSGS
jgi:hypothetical protein